MIITKKSESNPEPVITFQVSELDDNVPYWYDTNNPEGVRLHQKGAKIVYGYRFDNCSLVLTDGRGSVTFHIHKGGENDYSLSVWEWGTQHQFSLGHKSFTPTELGTFPTEVLTFLFSRLSMSATSTVPCSCCGEIMHRDARAGIFFAGVYCNECWHHKGIKEKEAAETYD